MEQYFLDSLNFLYNFQWLHNAPVTQLLSKELLKQIPSEWREIFQRMDTNELNDLVSFGSTKSHWPESLVEFIETCKRLNHLPSSENVNATECIELETKFKKGLSEKKQHEIQRLASFVVDEISNQNIELIVDIGSGLGYICQLLHDLHGYKVLGLEADAQTVNGALERQDKYYPESKNHVKYLCCKLTRDSIDDVRKLLEDTFDRSEIKGVCIIGLHACGDLTVDAANLFMKVPSAQSLILLPCCYHKMAILTEQSSTDEEYFYNFPLSKSLKEAVQKSLLEDIGVVLRRTFLRLACQDTKERWNEMSLTNHQEHAFHVLARATLQLYADQNSISLKKKVRKGTRKSQCLTFETYAADSMLRYSFDNIDGAKEQNDQATIQKGLIELWNAHSESMLLIEAYTGLQTLLQGMSESLILFDRTNWLEEQGVKTRIAPIMSRKLSPRSYAIVSNKSKEDKK